MKLNSLHVLLTYRCNYECDHCFVWGSPEQSGVFTLEQLEVLLQQALDAGCIEEFYFEGGETFVYYPVLVKAVTCAHDLGFKTGVITNGYWATSEADALAWIKPLVHAGLDRLDISYDAFHGHTAVAAKDHVAIRVAHRLLLTANLVAVNPPGKDSDMRFRGRAAAKLTNGHADKAWDSLTRCPYVNLVDPSQVHIDPFGNMHLCHGIVMGNIWERPLQEILAGYNPHTHAVVSDLVAGGPTGLVQSHQLPHADKYADACHLCYTARERLRSQYPEVLAPDQMYGIA